MSNSDKQDMPAIIVDIDGTLSDPEHRRHHIRGDDKDWDAFYEGIPDDPLNKWCREVCDRFAVDYKIILVTGRRGTEDVRLMTKKWLRDNGVRFDVLYMRGSDDYRSDDVVKQEIYEERIQGGHDVLFVLDDRESVVDMWRELGLTALQCAEGDF